MKDLQQPVAWVSMLLRSKLGVPVCVLVRVLLGGARADQGGLHIAHRYVIEYQLWQVLIFDWTWTAIEGHRVNWSCESFTAIHFYMYVTIPMCKYIMNGLRMLDTC